MRCGFTAVCASTTGCYTPWTAPARPAPGRQRLAGRLDSSHASRDGLLVLKAIIIIIAVIAVLGGGLLTLRSSRRTGMPSDEVLKRAADRAREQAAKDEADR